MDKFEEVARLGTCAVCGKKTKVVVCCSTFGAISYAYCRDCLVNGLEPYDAMVSYVSCAGLFPDDINETYQEICRSILNGLNISEEKFIEDVKKANKDILEWTRKYESWDGDPYDEKDDFC